MPSDSFTSLRELFGKTAAKHNVQEQLTAAHACHTMTALLDGLFSTKGKKGAAKATDLKNGQMKIIVGTSSQAQEIALHKLDLLEKLREKGFNVKGIKTQIG